MKIEIIFLNKTREIFFVNNYITFGNFYFLLYTKYNKKMSSIYTMMTINGKDIKEYKLNYRVIKCLDNNEKIIKIKENINSYSERPFIKRLLEQIYDNYFDSVNLYKMNKFEFSILSYNEYIIFNNYLIYIKNLYKSININNPINDEDPISFENLNEIEFKYRFYWIHNGKTYWMNINNIKSYLEKFTIIDNNKIKQIIHPFYQSFISEPWRTDLLYLFS
jgi:hypothetical protein